MSRSLQPRDGTSWVRLRALSGQAERQTHRPDERQTSPSVRGGQAWFRVDAEGRIADWNTGAARVTGLTADAVVGRPLSELSQGEGRWASRFEQGVASAAETEAEFEEWVWRPDGRRICVAASLKGSSGEYWASLRDVTVRRQRDSRAAALYAVGRVALDAKNVDDLIERTLERCVRRLIGRLACTGRRIQARRSCGFAKVSGQVARS